jgi:hypothetical protein
VKVTAAEAFDLKWIVDATSCVLTPAARAIKAVDAGGRIRGMVAFDWWTKNSVYAHMAVDTPIAWRALIPACFEYPFLEAKRRSDSRADSRAQFEKSWDFAGHLGFRIVHTVRDGWAKGDDLHLLELRREDCRFLRRN